MRGRSRNWRSCALTGLTLTLLAAICACGSPLPLPLPVPPLPAEARQPQGKEIPSVCSLGCSKGLMQLRQSWLNTPTELVPPETPASGPTRR